MKDISLEIVKLVSNAIKLKYEKNLILANNLLDDVENPRWNNVTNEEKKQLGNLVSNAEKVLDDLKEHYRTVPLKSYKDFV
jgi:hypothetical protein